MSEGFPILTTKRVGFKTLSTELEGFIKGVTSKEWYSSRDCNIWNEWCNPEAKTETGVPIKNWPSSMMINWNAPQTKEQEELCGKTFEEWKRDARLRQQRRCDDLGPIYGYQWRRWNEAYSEDCNGQTEGIDQLGNVVEMLKNNPNDRRLVVSAWNPSQIHMMALPPCHMMFVLTHIEGELSLHWTQRSCDLFLGVPFNIASYGLLLELICREVGMKAGNLSGMLCNCHIYENHMEQCREQASRTPGSLPGLEFDEDKWTGMFDWQATESSLHDYYPQAAIKAEVAI